MPEVPTKYQAQEPYPPFVLLWGAVQGQSLARGSQSSFSGQPQGWHCSWQGTPHSTGGPLTKARVPVISP